MDIHKKLLRAVQSENITEVIFFLQAGADPNFYFQQDNGFDGTLLHYTQSGEIAEELLRYGAFVDSRDWYGSTPLFHAVQRGCIDVVKVLLNNGASLITMDGLGERVLTRAIRSYKGDMEIIRELIKYGANMYSDFWNPFPPLHIAVMYNQLDVIDELLKQGAYLEQRDDHSSTALHLALQNSSIKLSTIKKLLEVGADTNKEYVQSQFPIDLAILHRDVDVVRELLKYGAKIGTGSEHNASPLYKAVTNHKPVNIAIIQELLNHGAEAGSYTLLKNENSPTGYAVNKHIESKIVPPWVKLLLKYSTIEYLEVYEYYSTTHLRIILGKLSEYAIECISEVSKLRLEIVDEKMSLYDYIKRCVRNEICLDDIDTKVTSKIFGVLASNDYPIYKDIISAMISKNYLIQKIDEEKLFTYSRKSKKVVLISDNIYSIVRYLSNTDLLNLALAYHGLFAKM